MSNKANQESICTNGTRNTLQSPQGAENRAGTQTLVDTSAEQKARDLYIQAESCHDRAVPPAEQQAAPKAEPVPAGEQEELREGASYESMNLAAMVLSDCGHSSNYMPLLERVAGRIDRHAERLLTAQQADRAMRAQTEPAAVAGPSDSEIDALVVSIGPTEGMRRDSRDLTMDKLRVLVRRALATWGHIKAAPWEQNESAYQRGYMDGIAKGRRDVDAAPQQEAQEPVAWQGVHDQTDLYYTKPAQADVRPLYTTTQPAPAAQGDALDAALTWTVFNSGAQVAEVKSLSEAMEYLTPARLSRQWCAVCVVNKSNLPAAARHHAKKGANHD